MSTVQQLKRGLSAANTANLIAVAAAAGSLETIKTLASQNRQLLWIMSPAFGYSLNAAVYADQLVVTPWRFPVSATVRFDTRYLRL
jgi:hypothetical protein